MSLENPNRRWFLRATAVITAGLAGCSSDGDDDDSEDNGDDGDDDSPEENSDGDERTETAPSASFSYDFVVTDDDEVEEVTITIDTIDSTEIDPDTIVIRGDGLSLDDSTWDRDGASVAAGSSVTISGDDDEYEVGDLESGDEIQIIFEAEETSETLDVGDVP